ncbi:MAG: SBBP repeat-containing protein [Bacteroidetes bacterium]|nr:SBBP repeat-containing protein [Bacteroidota bacterium]
MKIKVLCILVFGTFGIFNQVSFAQVPGWLWAKCSSGSGMDLAYCITTDSQGNIYQAGRFDSYTLIFDTITLTNSGYIDLFLVKYNANGHVVWAKTANGPGNDEVRAVAVDPSGNIYISGEFDGSFLNFGTITLTSNGNADLFLARYDSDGNVVWARSTGGLSTESSTSVACDLSGNVYITGEFGSSTITFDTITLTNHGLYLAKYDPSGNVLWAKCADGTNSGYPGSVATDASGNCYVTGYFWAPSLTFGSVTLTTADNGEIFLLKFNSQGDIIWGKSAGGPLTDNGCSVAVDASGNVYVSGIFYSPAIMFDSIFLTNASFSGINDDLFLAKYDAEGNVLWARSAGGTYIDEARGVAVDGSGNAYITGIFNNPTLVFGSTVLSNAGQDDLFVTMYDANGNIKWAKSAGGYYYDEVTAIALDALGSIYLTGQFKSNTLIFGPDTLMNTGLWNIFLAKAGVIGVGMDEITDPLNVKAFPNPVTDYLYVIVPQQSEIEMSDITGKVIKTIKTGETKTTLNVSFLSGGIYVLKVKAENQVFTTKFVKE